MADVTRIEVNIDEMSWGDMRLLLSLNNGEADPLTIADLFDRFVVGGADAVPITRTMEVIEALTAEIGGMTDPKNSASSSTPTSGRGRKRRSNT